MSYILEALKKLEQKRRQEGIPDLLTPPALQGKERRRRSVWPYVILAALVVNAGIIALVWRAPWRHAQPPAAAVPPVAAQIASSARETPVAGQALTKDVSGPEKEVPPVKIAALSPPVIQQPSVSAPPATPRQEVAAPAKAVPAKPAVAPPPTRPAPPADIPAPPGKKVVPLKELPPTIRSSLPELKMTVHLYNTDPSSRMVVINSKTFREGQSPSPGLKVEQITPAGVVFSSQGYRFLLAINENI